MVGVCNKKITGADVVIKYVHYSSPCRTDSRRKKTWVDARDNDQHVSQIFKKGS
jgi:hypothetical protein